MPSLLVNLMIRLTCVSFGFKSVYECFFNSMVPCKSVYWRKVIQEGCDGSIPINNGPKSEKRAFAHQGVREFEVIEKAKTLLEPLATSLFFFTITSLLLAFLIDGRPF